MIFSSKTQVHLLTGNLVHSLQSLNGCFDLAVVILVAVISDTQDGYQFRVSIGNARSKLRKIKPCHYNLRQFPV